MRERAVLGDCRRRSPNNRLMGRATASRGVLANRGRSGSDRGEPHRQTWRLGTLLVVGTLTEDIQVAQMGSGRYRAEVGHDWDVVKVLQGGVVAAVALRASAHELSDPDLALRTSTTVFAGQVAAGTLDVTVDVLRRGRSAAQVLATVRNPGSAAGISTTAVFGSARRGPSFVDVAPPDVPGPSECLSYRDAPSGVTIPGLGPFWDRVDRRLAMGHPPWEEFEPASSDLATWLRFDEPPLTSAGSLDPLGVVVLADRIPGAIAERIGLTGPMWFAPSADLTVHLCEPAGSEWILAHDRARWAGDGWASIESTLWDEHRSLVAYATQMVLFTYMDDQPAVRR